MEAKNEARPQDGTTHPVERLDKLHVVGECRMNEAGVFFVHVEKDFDVALRVFARLRRRTEEKKKGTSKPCGAPAKRVAGSTPARTSEMAPIFSTACAPCATTCSSRLFFRLLMPFSTRESSLYIL